MKKRKLSKFISVVLAATVLATSLQAPGGTAKAEENSTTELKLWYDEAAPDSYDGWEKWALPIGNSAIGASVFGGTDTERIQLNEKSLWSGGPAEGRDYKGGNLEQNGKNGETIKEVQKRFASGDSNGAKSLCNSLVGVSDDKGINGYGYYLSYGNMYLDFANKGKVENYYRDLNLRNAISSVSYDQDGVHFTRENFVSYPDNVLVTRLTADKKGALNFDVRVEPDNEGGETGKRTWKTTVKDGGIAIDGQLDDNQLKFSSYTKVLSDDGNVKDNKETVTVKDATEVTIITSIGTDYKNDYPEYRTGESKEELAALIKGYVDSAAKKGFEKVKEDHIKDYSSIFARVDLKLGEKVPSKTTDELLKAYNDGSATKEEQRYLEILLFQHGRYLTMGSSRNTPEGNERRETLPSNLQGIWVGKNESAWHSDYHMNVNLQMNYWPTYSTNMHECAEPLINYVDSLREPGRVTAEIYAGVKSTPENPENGFMAHTQNNPFGWTCPGWSFSWGWSPAAVPWILQNCFEYYEFTGDVDYLREKIYPMLKEEAILYDQMLVNEETGGPDDGKCTLVSSPSYSPEHGPYTAGNTYEHSLIWQLYEDTIKAAEILGVDADLTEVWRDKQSRLKGPIEIGEDGQIKEWYEETTLGSVGGEGYNHRHLSHMLGLFPGDLISPDTEEWFEAAKVSMQNRTDSSTGWGMGQRINTWARLGEGDKAHKLIQDLFRGGILTNLWDTHAPFQIDGNFGYTSGVAEMLIQSNQDYINLLPALPGEWADGSVRGLMARGNFEVSMAWADKNLEEANITSNNGTKAVVQYKNISLATVKDSNGNIIPVNSLSKDRIEFDTTAGETYTITNIPAEDIVPTPEKLVVNKIEDNKAELTWNAVVSEEKAITYNVYRQVGNGDVQKIATVDGTSYVDATSYDELEKVKYQVTAVAGKTESKPTGMVEIADLRGMSGMIDDQDPRVVYTGNWGNWNNNTDGNYGNTIKYLNQPKGGETAELTFVGTGIKVIVATNSDRGMYEVFIDGESKGKIDTYSPGTKRQQVVFEEDNLEYKKHTITLKVLNEKQQASSGTKVELDAFEVLDNTVTKPETINVSTVSGINVIGKAGSSVKMTAEVLPETAKDKSVSWSVSDNDLAEVNSEGVVTIKGTKGEFDVIATSNANPSVTGKTTLKIAVAGKTPDKEEIIDDGNMENVKNDKITWSDHDWSVWSGEKDKHYGGTKTEVSKDGAWFEYEFTGTGVEVYAQKHANFSSYDVYIDDVFVENASLAGSSSGDPQSLIFKSEELENTTHKIKCVAKERDGKHQVNLDYIKVFIPGEEISAVDKAALQESITNAEVLVKDEYKEDVWTAFEVAYNKAVEEMNNEAATEETVATAKEALDSAVEALGTPVKPTPSTKESEGKAILAETTSVVLKWDEVKNATSYKVVADEADRLERSVSALEYTTDTNMIKIDNLKPATTYNFKVYAVNDEKESEDFIAIDGVTTVAVLDTTVGKVTDVKKVRSEKDIKLLWTAPEDEDIEGFYIYRDGKKIAELSKDDTTYTFKNVTEGELFDIKIVAFDKDGNTSIPEQVVFTAEAVKVVSSVEAFDKKVVENGTSFEELKLPSTVKVTLEGNVDIIVDVNWDKEAYKSDLAGEYVITGELVLPEDTFNPKGIKAEMTVEVKFATNPDGGKPDTGKPDTGKPDTGKPDTGKPDAGKPDTGKPDAGKPDTGKPDAGKPDTGKPDAGKPDVGKPDGNKPVDNNKPAPKPAKPGKETPKTGDTLALGGTIAVIVLAGGAIVLTLMKKRKQK